MKRRLCIACVLLAGAGCAVQRSHSLRSASPTAEATAVWAGIVVARLDVSTAWYRDKLGFKLARSMDLPAYKVRIAFLELNGFTLELVEFQSSVSFETVKARIAELEDRDHLQGFAKLGFRIPDVDALASALKAGGVKLRMEPTDERELHDRFFLVEDPDGNTLQFFQRLP